jgi:hypothetical protein
MYNAPVAAHLPIEKPSSARQDIPPLEQSPPNPAKFCRRLELRSNALDQDTATIAPPAARTCAGPRDQRDPYSSNTPQATSHGTPCAVCECSEF